ncbi:MAG: type II glyceraldehyde-3-phosphate dehydrogenase [Pyrodictiaceae archaeon]
MRRIKVGVNGYGTIGKRVADAILRQPDMELVGIVKTRPDYVAYHAVKRGIRLYTLSGTVKAFEDKGLPVEGTLEDLLGKVDVIVDATPGGTGRKYKDLYKKYGVKAVFQGGEKADVAEASFSTLCNYNEVLGKNSLRVVSCNTTGLLRGICSIMKHLGIKKVHAVIIRRGADPKETKRGPINAIVPDPTSIPSHHALDVKTVLPWLDIMTAAVVVPTTLMHVHVVTLKLANVTSRDRITEILLEAPRILLIDGEKGFRSTADIVEFFRDYGRSRYDIPELVIWEDSITVNGDEVTWIQAVHQEAIVIPENIDAIRALMNSASLEETLNITDKSLGILKGRLT